LFFKRSTDDAREAFPLLFEKCVALCCQLSEAVAHGIDRDCPDPEEAVLFVSAAPSFTQREVVAEIVDGAICNAIVHAERVGRITVGAVDQ